MYGVGHWSRIQFNDTAARESCGNHAISWTGIVLDMSGDQHDLNRSYMYTFTTTTAAVSAQSYIHRGSRDSSILTLAVEADIRRRTDIVS